MIKIIPAILANNKTELKNGLSTAVNLSDWAHIDFVDGEFADNKTIGLADLKKLNNRISLEAHLMVVKPKEYVSALIDLNFKRIILPAEIQENLSLLISQIKDANVEAGLSLNPETPLSRIAQYIDQVDSVLLLGVPAGYSGQEFVPQVLTKLTQLVNVVPPGIRIEVDGGINSFNVKTITDIGADTVIIGSELIKSVNPQVAMKEILQSIN